MPTATAEADLRYMHEALALAHQAYAEGEVPVGALIVAGGKRLGKGYNQVERLHDPTAHAEMLALTAACNALGAKYLPEATLYVTLEPCPMCAGALRWAQVGRVVYGAPDPKHGYRRHGHLLHPKATVTEGVLEDDTRALLQSFFSQHRPT